jgi:geranylgeranyl diphosphate synthase type I
LSTRLESLLDVYAKMVDDYIFRTVRGKPEILYKASLHLIKAGGKRLRPFITLTTARMLSGPTGEARALPLAAAVELFHNFTLIHDDIIDKDEFRRGVPTTHVAYGLEWALLAGDLLFAESFKVLEDGLERGLGFEDIGRASIILARTAKKVSEGQALDMSFEKRWDVDVNDYLEMIYLKTGALIEASAMLGGVAALEDDEVVNLLGEYGRLIGIAFQIKDDILGIFGDPAKTKKPVYSDLRQGKKTILVIYAINKLSENEREKLKNVIGRRASEEEYREVAELIKESGALKYAEELAYSMSRRAIRILDSLDVVDEESREALKELALFVVERDH